MPLLESIEEAYIISPLPENEAEREEINQMIQRGQPPILASSSDNLSFVWLLLTVSYTLLFTWIYIHSVLAKVDWTGNYWLALTPPARKKHVMFAKSAPGAPRISHIFCCVSGPPKIQGFPSGCPPKANIKLVKLAGEYTSCLVA